MEEIRQNYERLFDLVAGGEIEGPQLRAPGDQCESSSHPCGHCWLW